MRNRMYGGVRGRKTKVGEKKTYFVFLLLDFCESPNPFRTGKPWIFRYGTAYGSLHLTSDFSPVLQCAEFHEP